MLDKLSLIKIVFHIKFQMVNETYSLDNKHEFNHPSPFQLIGKRKLSTNHNH